MLKRVQHDKKRYVIPNLFRNLEFANDNELIAFVLVIEKQNHKLHQGRILFSHHHPETAFGGDLTLFFQVV